MSSILDPGSRILGAGSWIQDHESTILDPGSSIVVAIAEELLHDLFVIFYTI